MDNGYCDKGWGPSEEELDECRYEELLCAAEIAIDDVAQALGTTLTVEQRESAIEEILETGLTISHEEDGSGGFIPMISPTQTIAWAQCQRPVRLPVPPIVCRMRSRRGGRRSVRRQRRSVRRSARAPSRPDLPDDNHHPHADIRVALSWGRS